ncbi:beta-lactamase family protein [Chloracidobacterium validum]|uniref:Beta-lactamase family protein n=1 Tax=Chloracidobacterium validum TaxID=2821543 RepID=A0ABX8BCS8_9BACT|nr:serine hydrolase domain-containing protein [Chloracidobacterium validum]QUW03449.1 beta-lactamase family protein [Chloracidobacterium validum]
MSRTRTHVSMDAELQNPPALRELLEAAVDTGEIQSAVWLVSDRGKPIAEGVVGAAQPDTIYDLASLTKPLVTALLCARLIECGDCAAQDTLGKWLPALRDSPYARASIEQALTHTAGFPAWLPLYVLCGNPGEALAVIAQTPPVAAPGTEVVYSDLGYIVLGQLLERLTGQPLDASFDELVAHPLGLTSTRFCPPPDWRYRVAPTEDGNAHERRMTEQLVTDGRLANPDAQARLRRYAGWRTSRIHGEVHDGNAYFLGGVSGHAGLFSTATEVWKLVQVFLPDSPLLRPTTCRWFTTNFTPGKAEDRSFGWMLASSPNATGVGLSPTAFGHLGFTGTSAWCDPQTTRVYVLLANRTFPFRASLQDVRRSFHALASSVGNHG